jgi:hypothetical protein
MALGDKPADLPEWATSGSAQITEPSAGKKALGWVKEKPTFRFFNWFWNQVYLWLAWARTYGETHVHNGGSGDHEAPKIELTTHIDWGSNGELEVITDTDPGVHEIDHRYTGGSGLSRFNSDVLAARSLLRIGGSTGQQFDLQDASGLAGARSAEVVGVDADQCGFRAAAFVPVNAQSPGGDFGTLHPEDSSLYRKNLAKSVTKFRFTEAAGIISNAQLSRYNAPGSWLTTGAPANTFILALGTATNVDGVVIASASVTQGGADTTQYKADVDYDAANTRLVMRLYRFDNSTNTWLNVRVSGPVTGMDMNVNVVVY